MNKADCYIVFLSYRTSEGKWRTSKILRIENINEKNLNFSYECVVQSRNGDQNSKSFILLKKGVRNFHLWQSVETWVVAAERPPQKSSLPHFTYQELNS